MEKIKQLPVVSATSQSAAWRTLWQRLLSRAQEDQEEKSQPLNTSPSFTEDERYSQREWNLQRDKYDGGSDNARGKS
jgi:hypothetical protein